MHHKLIQQDGTLRNFSAQVYQPNAMPTFNTDEVPGLRSPEGILTTTQTQASPAVRVSLHLASAEVPESLKSEKAELLNKLVSVEMEVEEFLTRVKAERAGHLEVELERARARGRTQQKFVEQAQREAMKAAQHLVDCENRQREVKEAIGDHRENCKPGGFASKEKRQAWERGDAELVAQAREIDRQTADAVRQLNSANQTVGNELVKLNELHMVCRKLEGAINGKPYRDPETGLMTQCGGVDQV